jgi:hypothetical protein
MCKTKVKPDFSHVNICQKNMKRTWQGYGVRLCPRLMLNRPKEMRGFTSIYIPLGLNSNKLLENLLNWNITKS